MKTEASPARPEIGGMDLAQAKNRDAKVEQIITTFRQQAIEHQPYYGRIQRNLALLSGQQWVKWEPHVGLKPVATKLHNILEQENMILPLFTLRQHLLHTEAPKVMVRRGGDEQHDSEASLVASRLSEHWRAKCGLDEARRESSRWVDVGGIAWIEPVWRKLDWYKTKRKRPKALTEPRLRRFMGHEVLDYGDEEDVEEPQGDLAYNTYTPMQVIMLPETATTWQRVQALLIADFVDGAWVQQRLTEYTGGKPIPLGELQAVNQVEMNLHIANNAMRMTAPGFRLRSDTSRTPQYLYIQWRERPSAQYPKGRLIVIVGNKLIYDGPLPHVNVAREVDPNDVENLTMGLVPVLAEELPGSLIPLSWVDKMVEPQLSLNRLLTMEAKNILTHAAPKIMIERGAVDKDAWTSGHGEIIEYDTRNGATPDPVVVNVPWQDIGRQIAERRLAGDRLSGNLASLTAQDDPNIRSARHKMLNQSIQRAPLQASVYGRERALGLVLSMSMAMGKRNYSRARIIEIYGRDYAGDVLSFETANLITDLTIENGSTGPRDVDIERAELIELFRYGAFVDPETGRNDTRRLFDMLRMSGMRQMSDRVTLERARIGRENSDLLAGKVVPVEDFDDDALHMDEHTRFMQRPQFMTAPTKTKALFDMHKQQHVERQLAQVMPGDMAAAEGMDAGDVSEFADEEQLLSAMADMGGGMDAAGPPTATP